MNVLEDFGHVVLPYDAHVCVCFRFRSEICGEEKSSSPPGDDQRGLPADHDGQQQRR